MTITATGFPWLYPTRVAPPLPGRSVMPCADCHRMLDLAEMTDVRPWAPLGRRRIVCRRCAS